MAFIELEKQDHLRQAIKAHKRTLLEADWKAQSLENGFPIMQTQEVQDVLKQVDESDFYTDGYLTKVDPEYQWILEKCLDEGLPGMPEDLDPNPGCPCDECVVPFVNKQIAEAVKAKRDEDVAAFFRDFDLLHSDSDPDPIVLALREIELGITKAEWDEHRAQKAAEDAEAIGAF